jgi:manganese transport protein
VFSFGGPAPDLREAHRLLTPLTGTALASVLFAVGLLCAGQSATLTGTLAGQIVMEGFVRMRLSPVARRLVTRALAIVPAVVVLSLVGDGGMMPLLIASQVLLSLQLPFAVVPLIRFTSSKRIMGRDASNAATKLFAWGSVLLVIAANVAMITDLIQTWHAHSPILAHGLAAIACAALVMLAWVASVPLRHRYTRVRSDAGDGVGETSGAVLVATRSAGA